MGFDSPFWQFQPYVARGGRSWQQAFLESRVKSPWAIGGNRSGKTEVGAFKVATVLRGFCPVTGRRWRTPTKVWAISTDIPTLDDTVVPKVMRYIEDELKPGREGWNKSKRRATLRNGSKVTFKSSEVKTSPEAARIKFQGADLDGVWFDEEPPFAVFRECWTRTIDRAGQVWGTMTPLLGSAWLYQRIYRADDPSFEVFTMAMTDNPYLPEEEIEAARKMYAGASEKEIDVRISGQYVLSFGRTVLHGPSVEQTGRYIRRPVFRGRLIINEVA